MISEFIEAASVEIYNGDEAALVVKVDRLYGRDSRRRQKHCSKGINGFRRLTERGASSHKTRSELHGTNVQAKRMAVGQSA